MSEKDEALQKVDSIKSILEDTKFFPYNYNALISWGIISIILVIIFPELLKNNLSYGIGFLVFMLAIGFFIEGFLIKKENINYDIKKCTTKQRFIFRTYLLSSLFGVALSALLAKYGLFLPIYMLWIFICGMGNFVSGYTINQKLFTNAGICSMLLAIILLIVSLFVVDLSNLDSMFARISQIIAAFSLGVIPIYIALTMKKETKLV